MSHYQLRSPHEGNASSSDEEDVFSALAKRGKGKTRTKLPPSKKVKIKPNISLHQTHDISKNPGPGSGRGPGPISQTSSSKRHHGGTKNRQDLDSLLAELKEESETLVYQQQQPLGGSYVRPGEEDSTTNVFVGNLAPSTTQKQLALLFGQFGELYSTKIMWPRDGVATKLNGFVCFVHRADAENALEAFHQMDPFGTGHVLTLSWGKHMTSETQQREYVSDNEEEVAWHRQGYNETRRGELTYDERTQFDYLFRTHLSASRSAICRAMAFCFEKSTAAQHICALWKPILLNVSNKDSVDTLIARLYLLSDVLFNSQQPGIRNAFLYRNFVEEVGPNAFRIMGDHSRSSFGRMKQDKLSLAVKSILGAWAIWGVYDPAFLYEARCAFEGKEPVAKIVDAGQGKPSQNRSEETIKTSPSNFGEENLCLGSDDGSDKILLRTDDIDGEPLEVGDLDGTPWSAYDVGRDNNNIDGEDMGDDVVLEVSGKSEAMHYLE